MKINNKEVIGKQFAYDGCHKIYIIENQEDIEKMKKYGYNPDTDFYDINELEKIYNDSCSLRFISNCSLTKNYVYQFETAIFEY